jgi:hypothetical protein
MDIEPQGVNHPRSTRHPKNWLNGNKKRRPGRRLKEDIWAVLTQLYHPGGRENS